MIEIPAAALIAEKLAEMVDFFSIGTNDLIQYVMAADRNNDRVGYLNQPAHPAVLGLIKRTVNAANARGIGISVCGEIAGNPVYTALLAGMGVTELSMSAGSVGAVRRVIRKLNRHDAEIAAETALQCRTANDVLKIAATISHAVAPEIVFHNH